MPKIERICEQCGAVFFVHAYVIRRGFGRFCSHRCNGNATGKLATPRTGPRPHERGANHPNWRGGEYRDGRGYVWLYRPEHPRVRVRPYVKRAVLVAEQTLGRHLVAGEIVHHRNGDKGDDRPENIEVLTLSAHANAHRKQLISARTGERNARGQRHWKSKLTEDEVRAIRAAHTSGTRSVDLAKRYSVTPEAIFAIVRRKSWAWLD